MRPRCDMGDPPAVAWIVVVLLIGLAMFVDPPRVALVVLLARELRLLLAISGGS